jgi:hypothetical protein
MALEASLTHSSSQRLPLSPAYRSTATAERADACARLRQKQATSKSTPSHSGSKGNKHHLFGDSRWTSCCNTQAAFWLGTCHSRRLSGCLWGKWRYYLTYWGNPIFTLSTSCHDAYCRHVRRNRRPDRGNDNLSSCGLWPGYIKCPDPILASILPASSSSCWPYQPRSCSPTHGDNLLYFNKPSPTHYHTSCCLTYGDTFSFLPTTST